MTDSAGVPAGAVRVRETAATADQPAMARFEAVFKVYDMGDVDVAALDGIDLVLNRGEFVAITGASGSGKSTLLHLLGCLDSPTQGRYWLEGHDVARLPDRELSRIRNRHFGFVFQAYNLLPELTARENVECPLIYAGVKATQRRQRARQWLARVGLADRENHLPSQLSGGQQQRVAIARALVGTPTMVLADEPTGNLNSEAGDKVLELLTELHAEGTSIVMVTHDPRVAAVAQREIGLADGDIVFDRKVTAEEVSTGAD